MRLVQTIRSLADDVDSGRTLRSFDGLTGAVPATLMPGNSRPAARPVAVDNDEIREDQMRFTGTRRGAIALTAGTVLSAACAAAPASAQQMRDVTFMVVNNLFSTPAYVAAENGYWAKQGLNVTVKLTGSGRAVVQAVQA